jgi:hypothetical protein
MSWLARALFRTTMLTRPPGVSVLGPLPFDVNIVFISGQSNSEDADALPFEPDAPHEGVIMLDHFRPRHHVGTFGTGDFVPHQPREDIDNSSSPPARWGGNMALACGKQVMQRLEEDDGLPYAVHGKRILVVHIGRSGSPISGFSYGSADFTRVQEHLAAVRAKCISHGWTSGIIAGAWAWGANAYDNNIGKAATKTGIHNYWKIGGDVDVYLSSIFGQQGVEFPVGFFQSAAHGPRAFAIDPYVATAENELVQEYARYHLINPEGFLFYNGADKGWSGSGVHHAGREAALMGAYIGWWVKRVVCDGVAWPSLLPSFTRVSARRVEATFAGFPAGHLLQTFATGLTPRTMQPNYGWCFCDPATPTTLLTLTRPPYPLGNKLVFEFTADLPVSLEVRHGAYASNNIHAGNYAVAPLVPEASYTVRGNVHYLRRRIPVVKMAIAA